MSETIERCGDCGCTFIGSTPKHHFSCSECGFEYVELDGLWYDCDRADEIQEVKDFRERIKAEILNDYYNEFFEGLIR